MCVTVRHRSRVWKGWHHPEAVVQILFIFSTIGGIRAAEVRLEFCMGFAMHFYILLAIHDIYINYNSICIFVISFAQRTKNKTQFHKIIVFSHQEAYHLHTYLCLSTFPTFSIDRPTDLPTHRKIADRLMCSQCLLNSIRRLSFRFGWL